MARTAHLCAAGLTMAAALFAAPATATAQSSSSGAGEAAAGLFALSVTTFIGAIMCFVYAIVPVLAIGSTVIWIFALVDLAQRRDEQFPGALEGHPSPNEKIVWLLIVILAGAVGAVVYYVMVMKKYPRAGTQTDPV